MINNIRNNYSRIREKGIFRNSKRVAWKQKSKYNV